LATAIRGTTKEDRAPVADIPPLRVGLSVDYQPTSRLWLRLQGLLYVKDDRPGPTEIVTPGYGVMDFAAGYRFLSALEVRVLIGNVFDKEYPGTPDELSVPAPGRNVTFVLAGTF
jgi:outer membrane receptor protein involved in Fe transport